MWTKKIYLLLVLRPRMFAGFRLRPREGSAPVDALLAADEGACLALTGQRGGWWALELRQPYAATALAVRALLCARHIPPWAHNTTGALRDGNADAEGVLVDQPLILDQIAVGGAGELVDVPGHVAADTGLCVGYRPGGVRLVDVPLAVLEEWHDLGTQAAIGAPSQVEANGNSSQESSSTRSGFLMKGTEL